MYFFFMFGDVVFLEGKFKGKLKTFGWERESKVSYIPSFNGGFNGEFLRGRIWPVAATWLNGLDLSGNRRLDLSGDEIRDLSGDLEETRESIFSSTFSPWCDDASSYVHDTQQLHYQLFITCNNKRIGA